jgi:hypothetical protein
MFKMRSDKDLSGDSKRRGVTFYCPKIVHQSALVHLEKDLAPIPPILEKA